MDTPEGRGTVIELDLLRQRVKVRLEEPPEPISVFPNAEIAVLRNGKAMKNDPPIPADLAPISGSGKRAKRFEKEETPVLLDPIKFRYSTEAIVEESEEEEILPEEPVEEVKKSRNRRRRNRGGKKEGAAQEQPAEQKAPKQPKAEKPAAPVEAAPAEPKEKKPGHRRNHRRRPKQNKPSSQE